jgi:hypothetical protein
MAIVKQTEKERAGTVKRSFTLFGGMMQKM